MHLNYQKIIEQYKQTEGIVYEKLLRYIPIRPDFIIYEVATNNGIYIICITDDVMEFDYLTDKVIEHTGEFSEIVEVKKRAAIFERRIEVQLMMNDITEEERQLIYRYANDQYTNTEYYLSFMFKKAS